MKRVVIAIVVGFLLAAVAVWAQSRGDWISMPGYGGVFGQLVTVLTTNLTAGPGAIQVTGSCGTNQGADSVNGVSVNKILNPQANPYCAKCDGVTDDATPWNSVFLAASNLQASGVATTVKLPCGCTTVLGSPVDTQSVTFEGCGAGAPQGGKSTIVSYSASSTVVGGTVVGALYDVWKGYGLTLTTTAGTFPTVDTCNLNAASITAPTGQVANWPTSKVTFTCATANPFAVGENIQITGVTPSVYNLVYKVIAVNGLTFTVFHGNGQAQLPAYGSGGVVTGTKLVGIQRLGGSNVHCCNWDLRDVATAGFGTGFDFAAVPDFKASNEAGHAANLLAIHGPIGFMMQGGGGFDTNNSNNFTVNILDGLRAVDTIVAFWCGPDHTYEEYGCGQNEFRNLDWEAPNNVTANGATVIGWWIGGEDNKLTSSYMVSGAVNAGQTTDPVDTASGVGHNIIEYSRIASTAAGGNPYAITASDVVRTGDQWPQSQISSGTMGGSLLVASSNTTTLPPMAVTPRTNVGGGNFTYCYALRGSPDSAGTYQALVSGFTCSFDAPKMNRDCTALNTPYSCCTNLGTGTCTDGENIWPTADQRFQYYDVLWCEAAVGSTCNTTNQSIRLTYTAGSNGNEVIPDNNRTASAYTYDAIDRSGVVDRFNFFKPVQFAALPACNAATKGAQAKITDDNAACTFGTIAGGTGGTYCPVGCDGSNWLAGY